MSLRSFLLFMLVFQLACIGAEAQTPFRYEKRDYTWAFSGENTNNHTNYHIGEHIFEHDSLELGRIFTYQYHLYQNMTCISDTIGHLQLFSNGWTIYNSNFDTMANGSGLAAGSNHNLTELPQREIALPVPDSGDSMYALFYTNIILWPGDFEGRANKLYYALVNIRANNGLGEVLFKDELITQDSLAAGFMTACRHANGRDWWILVPNRSTSYYFRYLLRPGGVVSYPPQAVPENLVLGGDNKGGIALFSSDGNRFARVYNTTYQNDYAYRAHLELFDFDRCEGLFYNRRHYTIPAQQGVYWQLAFAPSNRFLYINDQFRYMQFDWDAPDFMASEFNLGSLPNPDAITGCYWDQGAMKLGPDGVIYSCIAAQNATGSVYCGNFLSEIRYPDRQGDSCQYQMFARDLSIYWTGTYPNTASYRAGPIDGSACDTLGIDMHPIPWVATTKVADATAIPFQSIYPNPASGVVTVIYSLPDSPYAQWHLYNSAGQPVAQRTVSGTNGRIELDTAGLPVGLYTSVFITAGGRVVTAKLVVGR